METSTWYVRPKKSAIYGIGDGLSYENAFNGLNNYANGIIWGINGVKAGDTLYLCDEHTEQLHIFASGYSENPITIRGDFTDHQFSVARSAVQYSIYISNCSFILFKNIKFSAFFYYGDGSAHHITFDGCTLMGPAPGVSFACFTLIKGNDHWSLLNNTIDGTGNGVYTYARMGIESANYLTIKNNVIRNMHKALDNHAIGIQSGHGHIIESNYIEDTGGAIVFYTEGSHAEAMGGMVVKGNFIRNTRSDSMGCGIAVYDVMTDPLPGDLEYVIENNIILNTYGAGIYFGTIENRPFRIHNNTIMTTGEGYGVGIGVTNNKGVEGSIYNNIVVNPYSTFINIAGNGTLANLKIDNNLYYSSIGDKKWFSFSSFSEYKNKTGFDKNSIAADPQFMSANPLLPEQFRLKDTSPAINAGFNWGQVEDFFGNQIQGISDIGAIKWMKQIKELKFPFWIAIIILGLLIYHE